MNLDQFFSRTYDRNKYNCGHFASEVWKHETNEDISGALTGILVPMPERKAELTARRSFRSLPVPVSPCLVLMRRNGCVPHVGVYLRGRVLHITERGVQFQPLDIATVGFKVIGFYAYCHHSN